MESEKSDKISEETKIEFDQYQIETYKLPKFDSDYGSDSDQTVYLNSIQMSENNSENSVDELKKWKKEKEKEQEVKGAVLSLCGLIFMIISGTVFLIQWLLNNEMNNLKDLVGEKICDKTFSDQYYNYDNDCCRLIYNFTCSEFNDKEAIKSCENLSKFNKFLKECLHNINYSDFFDLIEKYFEGKFRKN